MRNGKIGEEQKILKILKLKKNVFDYVSLWLLIQVHQERKEEKKKKGKPACWFASDDIIL